VKTAPLSSSPNDDPITNNAAPVKNMNAAKQTWFITVHEHSLLCRASAVLAIVNAVSV